MRLFAIATALVVAATPASAATVTADVVYGHKAGMALVYDVFQPEQANGAGVLFMVSGGWFSRWQPPERRQRTFQHLLDAGFTMFAVHHGSAPRFKVPDAVADVRRAVRHVRAHASDFGIDPERLGVYGGSAGGHLSLMLGLASDPGDPAAEQPVLTHSNRVHAVVAYFPPVDLRGIAGPNERFPALDFDPELAADISPIQFVSEDDPPVLLIHGDVDELVPLSNSERMNKALTQAGVENRMVVIEGAGHGFRGADRERAQAEMVAFFKTHLVGE
ncbi:MAG: alpha/beta hydrolase [Gammaproteobacteria bacterium]|nr:alpha/beta hydrolase [Gammaproteobacteria bacterium]